MSGWPPKDWRALLALLGSIGGAAMLTALVWWGCWMLMPASDVWTTGTEAQRAETIRWVLWICSGTISLVIIGLGFAVNRRSFRGKLGRDGASFGFEGGEYDDDYPPSPKLPDPTFGKDVP
jgi:hypothetical protein